MKCVICMSRESTRIAQVIYQNGWITLEVCYGCSESCLWGKDEVEKMVVNRGRVGVQLELPLR